MTKTILMAVIAVQAVLLAHSFISVTELKTELMATDEFVGRCEVQIDDLKAVVLDTKNICEQYIQDKAYFLMDYGNDHSDR